MPSDGFTIKSRIRNLLRSPSSKHKKNRRELLTSQVCVLFKCKISCNEKQKLPSEVIKRCKNNFQFSGIRVCILR
uniref:Uncharacterized protein n=1 Tax=Sphaeramia orbicularis TaxID=375764 RepID=A0A673BJW7_9TELE